MDRLQAGPAPQQRKGSLSGPGRACASGGPPGHVGPFSRGSRSQQQNRRSQGWEGEAELRREKSWLVAQTGLYQHRGCSYQHWALVRL